MGIRGIANPLAKGINRNLPCVCGSGKKVKKCHGQELVITQEQYDWIMNAQANREKEFNQALIDQIEAKKNQNEAEAVL